MSCRASVWTLRDLEMKYEKQIQRLRLIIQLLRGGSVKHISALMPEPVMIPTYVDCKRNNSITFDFSFEGEKKTENPFGNNKEKKLTKTQRTLPSKMLTWK